MKGQISSKGKEEKKVAGEVRCAGWPCEKHRKEVGGGVGGKGGGRRPGERRRSIHTQAYI